MSETAPVMENQAAFRALMDCMARPGEIKTVGCVDAPLPLMAGTAAILRSLADYETPIWLDAALADPTVAAWIRFQTGAAVVTDPKEAVFAVGNGDKLPNLDAFSPGSEDYPDRSTTLIVQVKRFSGEMFSISGPGIRIERTFGAEPLPDDFVERWATNQALFPCGIDLLLVAGDRVTALPRTVRVAARG